MKHFWIGFILAALVSGGALQATSIAMIGYPAPRPAIPIPGSEYISATRDGQADQGMFYFNLFGFGDRIRNADALVIGSSHAEFGIEAARLPGKRPFNMALGGGEGLNFASKLLDKYEPHPSIIALDPFSPDGDSTSTESTNVLRSTKAISLHRVLNIWAGSCGIGRCRRFCLASLSRKAPCRSKLQSAQPSCVIGSPAM
jgi:hypothetical protein